MYIQAVFKVLSSVNLFAFQLIAFSCIPVAIFIYLQVWYKEEGSQCMVPILIHSLTRQLFVLKLTFYLRTVDAIL